MEKEEFIQAFQQQYGGYICVSNEVIGDFYDRFYQQGTKNRGYTDEGILDLCKDYILSQGLEEEVVE